MIIDLKSFENKNFLDLVDYEKFFILWNIYFHKKDLKYSGYNQ